MTQATTLATVTDLYVYPIKSAAGTRVEDATVTTTGLARDRRWMIVSPDGTFLTQRTEPRMALIRPRIVGDRLLVSAPGMAELDMPLTLKDGEDMEVRIWNDTPTALRWSARGRAWMSEFLEGEYEPVYLPDARARQVDLDFARPGDRVGFADGYPFLIISEASLHDLNDRMEVALPMNRFRPSIVVAGCAAYAEDAWQSVSIGEITMRIVKPCARCVTTTVDQATAVTAGEPLRTLARYRKRGKGLMFGQNAVHDYPGVMHVGDTVRLASAPGAVAV